MKLLPMMEDIFSVYWNKSMSHLFPKDTKNKPIVYFIGYCHLLGALVLQFGIWFLPAKYLWTYILFCFVNIFSYYFIFNKKCFMTLLTNYYSNGHGTALNVRMKTAFIFLGFNILLCIIGIINPSYTPKRILKIFINYILGD